MTTEAVRRTMAALSAGEAEMYRLGFANAAREKLANLSDGADRVRAAYGTPALREKLNALAPDAPSRESLHGFMRNEGRMARTGRELGGSLTQMRLADEADLEKGIAAGLAAAGFMGLTGRPAAAMRQVFDTVRKVNPAMRGQVLEAARKVLLNPDPQAGRDFVARIEAVKMSGAQRERVLRVVMEGVPRSAMGATTNDAIRR